MSDEKLIEEAAKLAFEMHFDCKWDQYRGSKDSWFDIARRMRDFWAAHCSCGNPSADAVVHRIKSPCYHATPAEMDTAAVLRKAAEHVRSQRHRDLDVAATDLEQEADRLDQEQRENDRDVRIGRRLRKAQGVDTSFIGDESLRRLGARCREAVEAEKISTGRNPSHLGEQGVT